MSKVVIDGVKYREKEDEKEEKDERERERKLVFLSFGTCLTFSPRLPRSVHGLRSRSQQDRREQLLPEFPNAFLANVQGEFSTRE